MSTTAAAPVVIGPATIHTGDVLDVLRTLPDCSVHCCVTSPPYWNLRDYGTGAWEGGDTECDHIDADKLAERQRQRKSMIAVGERLDGSTRTRVHDDAIGKDWQYRGDCRKCGARRVDRQIGLEATPEMYVARMVAVFREVRRVLRDDGIAWINLGDSYAGGGRGGNPDDSAFRKQATNAGSLVAASPIPTGLKPKDLVGIPWRVAFALQADGWWLRSDVIWHKPNPMPESVTDRPTKAHEYLFLLAKSERYYYDAEAIKEEAAYAGQSRGGSSNRYEQNAAGMDNKEYATRNKRSVWTVNPAPYKGAHFATFPPDLIEPCILAGTSEKGCCPECGAPWERLVDGDKYSPPEAVNGERFVDESRGDKNRKINGKSKEFREAMASRRTVSWQPACECNAGEPVPCTVIDPFNGSGTTGEVCMKRGRAYIGIELNPEYVELTRRRLGKVAPLFTQPAPQGS